MVTIGGFEWVSSEPITYSHRVEGNSNISEGVCIRHLGSTPDLYDGDWTADSHPYAGLIEIEFDLFLGADGGGVPNAHGDQNHDGVMQSWELDLSDSLDDQFALH